MVRKWEKYFNGTELRDVIRTNNSFNTLVTLNKELIYFIKTLKGDMEYEFEGLQDLVYGDIHSGEEELLDWIRTEDVYESLEELADDRLAQFYDLCDRWDVWVTLDSK